MVVVVQCATGREAFLVSRRPVGLSDLKCSCSLYKSRYAMVVYERLRLASIENHRMEMQLQTSGGYAGPKSHSKRQPGRGTSICRRAGSPGNDLDEEKAKISGEKKRSEKGGVEAIEEALGKAFGGVLWFGVLLVCLAIFGGGYVYLIYNYADFTDIPILRGPVGRY